ncbi:L-rhamnose-binding lectin CSL3-like [Xiphophorus hellerii]|uniref:L-rhamnose-binding lectin CSL3-like n=1 Tax=Xiphophorus hellerii TaxID=8084 RepID=UPI0013B37209|nr:L-rhamnose-binding lectin CSL3-like [Xiphophorus hellerii]
MKFVLFTLFLCGFILEINGKSSSGACLPEEKSLVACEGTVARLHCEEGQAIYVTSATYGRTDKKACSARRPADQLENTECFTDAEEVGERCNGKQWCKVKASNYVFGDPCYGTYKYLEVEYICYDSLVEGTLLLVSPAAAAAAWILHHNKMKFVLFTLFLCGFVLEINAGRGFQKPKILRVACEESVAEIFCVNGSISVISATYGRSDQTTCSDGIPDEQTDKTDCATRADLVFQICEEKSACAVLVSSSVFGDPCVGTYKYLEVLYRCEIPSATE